MLFHAAIVALALLSTVSSQSTVAFSAALTNHVKLPIGQLVVFNDVYVNLGNAYNKRTGIFTCTKGGTYQFHVTILSSHGKLAYTRLFQNEEIITTVYINQLNNFGFAGNSVILRVKKGDEVYVKAVAESYIFGDMQKYTTFSGALIGPWADNSTTSG